MSKNSCYEKLLKNFYKKKATVRVGAMETVIIQGGGASYRTFKIVFYRKISQP